MYTGRTDDDGLMICLVYTGRTDDDSLIICTMSAGRMDEDSLTICTVCTGRIDDDSLIICTVYAGRMDDDSLIFASLDCKGFFVCFFLQPYCPIGISPKGNSGCFHQGKPAATESHYLTYSPCWVF